MGASESKTLMAYNYRCSIKRRCGKRVRLAMLIDWYVTRPLCPACGDDTLVYDPAVRRYNLKHQCNCRGVHYPHMIGTYINQGEFCDHAKVDLTFEGARVTTMKPGDDCPF